MTCLALSVVKENVPKEKVMEWTAGKGERETLTENSVGDT